MACPSLNPLSHMPLSESARPPVVQPCLEPRPSTSVRQPHLKLGPRPRGRALSSPGRPPLQKQTKTLEIRSCAVSVEASAIAQLQRQAAIDEPVEGERIVHGAAFNRIQINMGTKRKATEELNSLLQQRREARSRKDFETSDRLRDELRSCGIQVFDTEGIWKADDGRTGPLAKDITGDCFSGCHHRFPGGLHCFRMFSRCHYSSACYGRELYGDRGSRTPARRAPHRQALGRCGRHPRTAQIPVQGQTMPIHSNFVTNLMCGCVGR